MNSGALLSQNRLAERFASLGDRDHFVVAETGSGTALNFLATWRLWRESNTQCHACLHFISVEQAPLRGEELARALAHWPDLGPLAQELIENYPAPVEGTHRLVLDRGRVRLTLCFGSTARSLAGLDFRADAWILDGFAPETIASHSGPGTTFATLTTASELQQRMSEAGFSVRNVQGSGEQPARLAGEIPVSGSAGASGSLTGKQTAERIGIVGAGIAGCLLANNLAGRGFQVTLIDQASSPGAEASGNRQGALYVKLGVDFNDQTELALSSLLFSQRFYQRFENRGWHPTGLIQLAYNEAEADRQSRFLAKNQYPSSVFQPISADRASQLAGIPVPHGGLWFPASGWLEPPTICRQLADSPDIAFRSGFTVASLSESGSQWTLKSEQDDTLSFDRIILCAGPDTPELIPLDGQYRMKRIRGQITEVPAQTIDAPSLVVCGPGYINPAFDGRTLVGATFDLHDPSPDVTEQSNRENLAMLAGLLPGALDPSDVSGLVSRTSGRVAFRCTTHDYQPIAGPMKSREGEVLNGLYLFTGLGSKGLTYSPLLAEYLGDLISGQPPCLRANLIKRVETQRCHRPEIN